MTFSIMDGLVVRVVEKTFKFKLQFGRTIPIDFLPSQQRFVRDHSFGILVPTIARRGSLHELEEIYVSVVIFTSLRILIMSVWKYGC